MRNKTLALVSFLACSGSAFAGACDDLTKALGTREGVSTYLKQETGKDVICAMALMPGGQESSYCYAIFDYRAARAQDALQQLDTRLSNCFPSQATTGAGALVNHPDSFDHKSYCAPEYDLSLSLKDKGNLNQTLIFLRLDERATRAAECA